MAFAKVVFDTVVAAQHQAGHQRRAEHEHGPRDPGDADAGGAHRGDLAVGGEAAEGEQHAGEHAHRQRVGNRKREQQAHEPGKRVELKLARHQRPDELAHDVGQRDDEREEPDRRRAGEQHAFEDVAVEKVQGRAEGDRRRTCGGQGGSPKTKNQGKVAGRSRLRHGRPRRGRGSRGLRGGRC